MPPTDELIFRDGLGDRLLARDAEGHPSHESLLIRGELSSVPSFEFALNERLWLVEKFDHPAYLIVRNIVRVPGRLTRIGLVHDVTGGIRLSEILARAEAAGQPGSQESALFVMSEILAALIELHRQSGDLSHGALAPERIVVADGKVRIADYVLGSAIEQLRFTTERYWKELRVAVPPTAGGARFDRRVDVAQIGMIALAMFAGRPLADTEYLGNVGELAKSVSIPAPIRGWLFRALHMDPRRIFMQASDALQALNEAMTEAGVRPDASDLQFSRPRAVLPSVKSAPPRPAPSRPSAPSPLTSSAPLSASKPQAPVKAQPPRLPVAPSPAPPAEIQVPIAAAKPPVAPKPPLPPKPKGTMWQGPDLNVHQSVARGTMFSPESVSRMPPHIKRYVWGAVLVILMAAAFVGSHYVPAPEWLFSSTGTLVIESNPQGVEVFINGKSRGTTPLTLKVESGRHEVELRGPDKPRIFNVFVSRGDRVAQYVEFPTARKR